MIRLDQILAEDFDGKISEQVENGTDQKTAGMVSEYKELKARYDAKKAAFRKEVAGLERKIKKLESALKEIAQSSGLKYLHDGKGGGISFESSVRRVIDPKLFFEYLKQNGLDDEFWGMVSVAVTKAEERFGRRFLEESGTLSFDVDEYGRIKME